MINAKRMSEKVRRAAALAGAAAAALAASPALAGQTGDAVTISTSGSTAFRNFITSEGPTLLSPGSTITLNSGPGGAEVTYPANDTSGTPTTPGGTPAPGDFWIGGGIRYQLGPTNASSVGTSGTNQSVLAIRFEWHEQGATEGVLELVNDQIGPVPGLSNRNPTNDNPVWVNRNRFPVNATSGIPATINGYALDNFGTPNGQSPVQLAFSDMNAAQAFSKAGTAVFNRTSGTAGYGKGNPYLFGTGSGIGQANGRQQLVDESVLNVGGRTGGTSELDNKTTAIQATTFAANPGTGLTKLNRSDAQWLQTAGRLANGADFNVTTRDAFSGTRNVAALSTGVDPSWASGENDNGTGALAETNIGAGIKFSNKTAGGGLLRPTVQNARMAVGTLSISDAVGASTNANSRPLRTLAYADSDTDAGATFVRANAQSLVDGSYAIYQNETMATVKDLVDPTRVQGDNAGNDVRDFRDNILNSVANFPAPATIFTPADALIQNGFILPSLTQKTKVFNAPGSGTDRALYDPSLTPEQNRERYNAALSAQFLASAGLTSKFATGDPSTVTTGTNAKYGDVTPAGTGAVPITADNYLFGDFRQTDGGKGTRDYSDLAVARDAQAALHASGAGNDMFAGGPNNTAITALPAAVGFAATKGDLIVLGDYDGNGRFDGRDLYRMARGTALADNATSETLTGDFADAVRAGVLRKNAALDLLNTTATPQQKLDATASATNDPTGANAFNKFDVNRDGRVDRDDAGIVDQFVGKDYRKLEDQLSAVVATNINAAGKRFVGDPLTDSTTPRRLIGLVDVELNDDGVITHAAPGAADVSDFKLIRQALGNKLLDGDTDFDGHVNVRDLATVRRNVGKAGKWSNGDFDFTGNVGLGDFLSVRRNYGKAVASDGAASSSVHLLAGSPTAAAAGGVQLVVDVFTGAVRLVGDGAAISGYEITSADGSLVPANLLSLKDEGVAGFEELGSLPNNISEASFSGSGTLSGGRLLGNIFAPGGSRDLSFSYGDASAQLVSGSIVFVPEPAADAITVIGAGLLLRRRRRA